MTMQSESIAKLADALAKAQAEMPSPKKTRPAKIVTKSGGSYSYKYADISDVIDCARPILAKHGISYSQATLFADGHFLLRTTLRHQGEWIASDYPLPTGVSPQEMGSLLTYHRRYQLCCLVGIAAETDDDGAGAQASHEDRPNPPKPNGAQRTVTPQRELKEWQKVGMEWAAKFDACKSEDELKKVIAELNAADVDPKTGEITKLSVLDWLRAQSPAGAAHLLTLQQQASARIMNAK